MTAGTRANASIVHDTPQNDNMESTSPPLLDDNGNNNIKDVDITEKKPAEIIYFDADDATNDQEYTTDENPGDNPSQNQDGVSNTVDDIYTTDVKDTTKYCADGDNTEGSIKVEDVDNEDYVNDSDDDANDITGFYSMCLNRKMKQKE